MLKFFRLISLGDGIFHKYLMFVCGLCMMGVITETLVVSYIVTSAECDLSLTMTDKGLLTGAAFFGTSLKVLYYRLSTIKGSFY